MASGTVDNNVSYINVRRHADHNTDDVIKKAIQEDPELDDVIRRLDNDVSIEADHELNIDEDSFNADFDSDSVSTSGSLGNRDLQEERQQNGGVSSSANSPENNTDKISIASSSSAASSSINGLSGHRDSPTRDSVASRGSAASDEKQKSSSSSGDLKKSRPSKRNPFQALKRLTKFHKDDSKKKQQRSFKSEFTAVVVDKLPQVFVVKYMGQRDVSSIFGLHVVRKPVDEMVKVVRKGMESEEAVELPLLYAVISPKGIDLRSHKNNKVHTGFPAGLMPIDFISYGVQDIKFWRVFTCIMVRELSSRTKSASCHAFLCDSSHSGRKMALALGAAFNVYSKKLKSDGKSHNFQVELRPPDELADAVDAECEA